MGRKPKDLSGQKFGMLTVKDMTKKRDGRGSVYWHCVCDCGNEVDVPAARLIQGTCHSCGCLQKKNRQEIAKRRHFVDGTCVEVLEKRKSRRDNMSGFRGVFKMKNCDKYRVIGMNKILIHIKSDIFSPYYKSQSVPVFLYSLHVPVPA